MKILKYKKGVKKDMKDYIEILKSIILASILVCSIINLSQINKTLEYLKYSDYVLNDALIETTNIEENENGIK